MFEIFQKKSDSFSLNIDGWALGRHYQNIKKSMDIWVCLLWIALASAFKDLNNSFMNHVQMINKHEASVVLFNDVGYQNCV